MIGTPTWILMLSLANYDFGPLSVDPELCRRIEMRVAARMLVMADREDGASILVRRARCIRRTSDIAATATEGQPTGR